MDRYLDQNSNRDELDDVVQISEKSTILFRNSCPNDFAWPNSPV